MKKLNLIKTTGCCSDTIDINEEDIDVDFFNNINNDELEAISSQRKLPVMFMDQIF